MRTLEEIKEQYATSLNDDYETYTWQSLISGNGTRNMEHHHDAVAKLYAKEVARKALKNASENAKTEQGYCSDGWTPSVKVVDKSSILNESNIPKL